MRASFTLPANLHVAILHVPPYKIPVISTGNSARTRAHLFCSVTRTVTDCIRQATSQAQVGTNFAETKEPSAILQDSGS